MQKYPDLAEKANRVKRGRGFRKDPAGVFTESCISLRTETEGKAELWDRQEQGQGRNAQVILWGQK